MPTFEYYYSLHIGSTKVDFTMVDSISRGNYLSIKFFGRNHNPGSNCIQNSTKQRFCGIFETVYFFNVSIS